MSQYRKVYQLQYVETDKIDTVEQFIVEEDFNEILKAHVRPRRIARQGIVFIHENLAILRVRVIQSTSIFGFLAWVVIPLFHESSSTI